VAHRRAQQQYVEQRRLDHVRTGGVAHRGLAASLATCSLAYWHHARLSSGTHANNAAMQPLWQSLYDAGADVVLTAHNDNYERFASQTPTGSADPAGGIRQFVLGTGGTTLQPLSSTIKHSSGLRDGATFGVLKPELDPTRYAWTFIASDGSARDSGAGSCH
jgi:acid phosphatase type 7